MRAICSDCGEPFKILGQWVNSHGHLTIAIEAHPECSKQAQEEE